MHIPSLGLIIQTIGAGLLALIFLYLSRESGNGLLRAAGTGWLMLCFALLSLFVSGELALPYGSFLYELFKILYFVALVVAADRMEHESSSLGKAFRVALLAGIPLSAALAYFVGSGPLFYAIHMGLGACFWFLIATLIFRSRFAGLGRQISGSLAVLTLLLQIAYVVFFSMSSMHPGEAHPFLSYTGFYDLFVEMFFGIGLIVWAMEDTERKLTTVHARAIDDTQRSKRRAQIDPLSEAYNRFFLEDIRAALARETSGGSIVLIDIDGLKAINDREGHEEGDRAIWTVAQAIKKLIRGDDYLVRWGGDEFLAILPGMDEEAAQKRFYMLPARIDEVKQSPRTSARAYKKFLSASVGITPFSSRVPFDMAIQMADRHMYERKKVAEAAARRSRPARLPRDSRSAKPPGGERSTTRRIETVSSQLSAVSCKLACMKYRWTTCPDCRCEVAINYSETAAGSRAPSGAGTTIGRSTTAGHSTSRARRQRPGRAFPSIASADGGKSNATTRIPAGSLPSAAAQYSWLARLRIVPEPSAATSSARSFAIRSRHQSVSFF